MTLKKIDDEVPVMLEFWGMRSTSSLPSLPGPLWPKLFAPDRMLYMGQIELNSELMLNWVIWNRTVFVCSTELFEIELFFDIECVLMVKWNIWNRTVLTFKLCTYALYLYSGLEWSHLIRSYLWVGVCCSSHWPSECGTRLFLWVWVQGCSPDMPNSSQNTLGLVGISLKWGTSGTRW